MGALAVVLMGGVIQDGWAHGHGLVDQSFITPWHAILYATMALNGIVLGAMAVLNLRRGYAPNRILPFGYRMSLAGVIVFAAGGVFDFWWHSLFGIETDINALISPSHIWLALGGALIFCGPLRSIAARYGPSTGGWRITGPAILSAVALLTLIGFFTQYAQPIGDNTEFSVIGRHEPQTGGALYIVGLNDSRETRLLTIAGSDIWGASVAPDGRRVAFRVSTANDPASDIYVANIDGSHSRRLTHSGRHDTQPAWSPDGKRIAFISLPAGTSGDYLLQTIGADGSGLKTLAAGVAQKRFPAWSPDGRFIAYETRNGLNQQIAIVPAGGGEPRWLNVTKGGDQAAWSRDGRIAFSRPDGSIGITDSSGKSDRDLIRNAQMPAWSSDGGRIAYIREAGGDAQVFVTTPSSGKTVNVSQLAGLDASRPAWTPGGGVVFTATGRPVPTTTYLGLAYSEDANLIEAIAVTGIALLLIRRWRMPFGAMVILFGLFSVAMAFQSDLFAEIIAAVVAGLAADVAIALLGERARTGLGFYALAFCIPLVLFAAYLIVARLALHGLGWPPNMIAGSPLIAGFAGLLIAFCYQPPLRSQEQTKA
jgi:Tol biopolymer transport system component